MNVGDIYNVRYRLIIVVSDESKIITFEEINVSLWIKF